MSISGPQVVTLGETMGLLRATSIGSLTHATAMDIGIGGAESNVAIALRRLGVNTGWLGRVGSDPLGARVLRELRAEDVLVTGITDSSASTGLMLKEHPRPGQSAVYYYRDAAAGSRLEPDDLPQGWVEDAEVLHLTGITPLLSATAEQTVREAIRRATAAGTTISFDINHRLSLPRSQAAEPLYKEIAEKADIVFGGADEIGMLGAAPEVEFRAEELAEALDRHIVLKLGADGAVEYSGGTRTSVPAFSVEVADTVGAGDAFVAGYLSAWLEGLGPEDRLQRGNACGALLCMSPGDWEASPRRQELEQFLSGPLDPVRR